MTLWQALILAVVQGLTEFFPVSSSGHLAIAQAFMKDFAQPGLAFEVVVHLGTLLSVFVYFRKDFAALLGIGQDSPLVESAERTAERERAAATALSRMHLPAKWGRVLAENHALLCIVIASVPTGILGLALRDLATRAFGSLAVVGGCLVVTGMVLYVTAERAKKGSGAGVEGLTWKRALVIGTAQGIAVFPGISRSGATLAAGVLAGLDRRLAFSFSFILSAPAILGATALEARNILRAVLRPEDILLYALAFAVSAAVGYGALMLLRRAVEAMKLGFFAYYCAAAGGFALAAWWAL